MRISIDLSGLYVYKNRQFCLKNTHIAIYLRFWHNISMDLTQQLQEIGLEGKKAAVYLALLKLQEATPHQVAQEAEVERTTVYKLLNDLASAGLVTKAVHGKRISYFADPASSLKVFLNKKQNLLDSILPTLFALQGDKRTRPKVQFYDNLENIRQVLMNSLESQEKLRRDFAFIENVVEFLGLRFIQNQIKQRVKKGIYVRSLRQKPKKPETDWFIKKDNKDVLREVRYLDAAVEPLVIIYDNVVAVISSRKESYALVIESQEFSNALKALFDIAWRAARL